MSDVETTDETTAPEPVPEPLTVHGATATERAGETVVFPSRDAYADLMRGLRDDGFEMCIDVTAVDHLQHRDRSLPAGVQAERFEVVVNLLSLEHRRRIRVRVQVPESDPTLPSLFRIWPGTEAMEREVWDMFGIAFDEHPDLTRILMPEDWEGHPLRKDYAQGRVPVQFKAPNMSGGGRTP